MTVNHLVHCHICPLKDFCKSGNPNASWRVQHEGQYFKREGLGFVVQLHEKDFEVLKLATANCPLRRTVAYADSLQVKNLLRSLR
jgi:hypothetical protein